MTVNELIAELQVLAAQGHGKLDVKIDACNGKLVSYDSATAITVIKEDSVLTVDSQAWILIE